MKRLARGTPAIEIGGIFGVRKIRGILGVRKIGGICGVRIIGGICGVRIIGGIFGIGEIGGCVSIGGFCFIGKSNSFRIRQGIRFLRARKNPHRSTSSTEF